MTTVAASSATSHAGPSLRCAGCLSAWRATSTPSTSGQILAQRAAMSFREDTAQKSRGTPNLLLGIGQYQACSRKEI